MSAKQLAQMYVRGRIRGDLDNFAESGRGSNTVHAGHHGGLLRMHSATPPPVEEYERWLSERLSNDRRARPKITGAKLRRMVVMRRQGSEMAEIGRAVGLKGAGPRKWLAMLPPELAA